jgi:hypothetical protein
VPARPAFEAIVGRTPWQRGDGCSSMGFAPMELRGDPHTMWLSAAGAGCFVPSADAQRSHLIEQEGQWRRVRAVNLRRLNSRLLRVDLDIAWALADGRVTAVGTVTCACRGSTRRCGDHGCESRRRKQRCGNACFDGHRESPHYHLRRPPIGYDFQRRFGLIVKTPSGLQPVQRVRARPGFKEF